MIKPSKPLYYLGLPDAQLDDRISCPVFGGFGERSPIGLGSTPHGYFTGGFGNNLLTANTDVLNFTTEITNLTPSAELTLARWTHAGLSNGSTCYFAGGGWRNGSTQGFWNSITDVTDKITLATDTTAASGAQVEARYACMGVSNQAVGLVVGGLNAGGTTMNAESFDYAAETWSSVSGTLQTGATFGGVNFYYEAGEVSNATSAYMMGGFDTSDNTRRTTADIVTFATLTVALSTVVSSVARSDVAAAGNTTSGIFIGGDVSVYPTSELTLTDVMEQITYATDTLASAGTSTFDRMDSSATGDAVNLYASGGWLGDTAAAWLSDTSRVDYATATLTALAAAELVGGERSSMEAAGSSYF